MLPILQSRRREAIELLALQQLHRGRVLDLNTRVGKQRITDLSPYGNNATLKSGVYFSTDGLADKGIGADCSAEGSGDYYYTARIRSSSTGTKWATIGGAAVSANLPSADVWTDVTFSTASSVTPSACYVGWDGASNFSDCDWSEVKLWKVGVSDPVAYWPGCDSEAASLDGHFVADVSGNGYHGAHVGGSSGSGETDILQTAGMNWNIGYGKIAETIYEFSANVQNFVSDAGDPVLAAAQSIGGENDAMQATYTAKNYFYRNATTVLSKKYQILFDVYVPSSNTTLTAVRGRINFTGSQYTPYSTLQDQWETVEGLIANDEVTGLPTRLYFYVNTYTTGDVVYIRNIVIREVASTSLFLIPASPTDTTVDIFGNPIDNPRPNGKVINLASGNLSAQVAADASMDATQAVYGWVYYDGTDGDFFDLGAPTIGATSGALTATNFSGALTYYVNGVATSTLGAAGWKLIGIASNADQGTDAIDLLRTCAALRFSERVLTAAEIAALYDAEKSQYGL